MSTHPAAREPIEARFDYACVIASLAGADGDVSDAELRDLEKLAGELELPEYQIEDILAFARQPRSSKVRDALIRLRESDLRFTLITDMVVLGLADGTYDLRERKQIRGLATIMQVDEEQVTAIEQYVLDRAKKKPKKTETGSWVLSGSWAAADDAMEQASTVDQVVSGVAATLAGVGVPAAAVVGLAGGQGLSLGGIVASLGILGFGVSPFLGVGTAFGLGFASFHGVRWAYRRLVLGEPTINSELDED